MNSSLNLNVFWYIIQTTYSESKEIKTKPFAFEKMYSKRMIGIFDAKPNSHIYLTKCQTFWLSLFFSKMIT